MAVLTHCLGFAVHDLDKPIQQFAKLDYRLTLQRRILKKMGGNGYKAAQNISLLLPNEVSVVSLSLKVRVL